MAVKKGGLGKGLGRGLDSLIPVGVLDNEASPQSNQSESGREEMISEKTVNIMISKVEPNRDQPRKNFDEKGLNELADSIRQFGVIQPILVQKREDHYEIIAGERRWRAAKLAGLKEVPVIVREYTEQEIMEIALIENIQRENLNPIEEAQAYRKLIEEFHVKHEEIAERVSKSRAFISNSMRLLKLDENVQQMVIDGQITNGHARALLSLENKEEQIRAAQKIIDEDLSVRATEKLVKTLLESKPEKQKKQDKDSRNTIFYDHLAEQLSARISARVTIKNGRGNKGKIEIDYYSLEELERIQAILERQ